MGLIWISEMFLVDYLLMQPHLRVQWNGIPESIQFWFLSHAFCLLPSFAFPGQANMIQFLIDQNADYNSKEYYDGDTPLHVAVAEGLLIIFFGKSHLEQ